MFYVGFRSMKSDEDGRCLQGTSGGSRGRPDDVIEGLTGGIK